LSCCTPFLEHWSVPWFESHTGWEFSLHSYPQVFFFGDQTQPLATPHMRPQLNNYRRSQHSLECKDPCRLIRDLDLSPVHPKINAFQESSWNICMTSLVILAATCFFRYRVKKNIQTNRQTEEHRPYPATSGGVGENPARMS